MVWVGVSGLTPCKYEGVIARVRQNSARGMFVGSVSLAAPDTSADASSPPDAPSSTDKTQSAGPTVTRELMLLAPAFVALLVFLALLAVSTTVGNGTAASAPDVSTTAGALSALVLGLVINPRPGAKSGKYWTLQSVVWAFLALGALGVGVFAAVEVFDRDRHAAGAALTAALAAFGGLFVNATQITHSPPVSDSSQSSA